MGLLARTHVDLKTCGSRISFDSAGSINWWFKSSGSGTTLKIRLKMKYCCNISTGDTLSLLSSHDKFKIDYTALMLMNYFPHCNLFPTKKLQARILSLFPNQIFRRSTFSCYTSHNLRTDRHATYKSIKMSHPPYSFGKETFTLWQNSQKNSPQVTII